MAEDQIFKRNLTGFNTAFSPKLVAMPKFKKTKNYYFPIATERIGEFIPFTRIFALREMQTPSSRIYIWDLFIKFQKYKIVFQPLFISQRNAFHQSFLGCPSGVMVKAMDCRIVVSEFVLQSRYYVHFQANTLGKGMNPLILSAMG